MLDRAVLVLRNPEDRNLELLDREIIANRYSGGATFTNSVIRLVSPFQEFGTVLSSSPAAPAGASSVRARPLTCTFLLAHVRALVHLSSRMRAPARGS
eukprot:7763023-Pyramimonas_sp.AAC.1